MLYFAEIDKIQNDRLLHERLQLTLLKINEKLRARDGLMNGKAGASIVKRIKFRLVGFRP